MKTLKLIIGFLAGIVILTMLMSNEASAQGVDEGFIYGQVMTIDGKTYKGQIRWGKEEAFWSDHFNASKESNQYIKELSREDMDELQASRSNYYREDKDSWGRWRVDWSWDNRYLHQFSCQFGEIQSIRITGRNEVEVKLKNGEEVIANGSGYNDVGTKVKVMDADFGEIKLDWSRIEKIDFMDTPKKIDEKFGDPLYGTVETERGTFTGWVQWDHDERLTTDKLDGDTRDGDMSISFGKIKSIEREGNGSLVVLNSGRQMVLRGSNDVNGDNRGIVVTDPEIGRIDIPFRSFQKVTFSESKNAGMPYSSYGPPKEINGKLKTSGGDQLDGRIVFDLDETYTFELLQGKDDDIEYVIPFRNIEKIIPKNYEYSVVVLKSGKKILLGESQDVSDKNYGVLVYSGNKEPVYIPWKDVSDLSFD